MMASRPPPQNATRSLGGTAGPGAVEGVRQRVNRCMAKMSDRDTEAMAASELDSIASSLTADGFLPFLSAIADTRSTDKTSLRRHSLRLLSLLSHSHPSAAVAPHLARMLAAVVRRLRDPDSSVRNACVEAVRSMAAVHPPALTAVLLRPLADALLHEQEQCAQTASALSLAAAIDAVAAAAADRRDPDLSHHLQRLLPRLVKLLRSNAFKAKPALLTLLGSAAGAGGAGTPALLSLLVPCLMESLASEDWAARKAGAEALSVLAMTEKELLRDFRSSCLSSFESRRFDKVKIVRESMNQMMDLWKDIPEALYNVGTGSAASQTDPSTRDTMSNGRNPATSVGSNSAKHSSPSPTSKSKLGSSRSPPPAASPIPIVRKCVLSSRSQKLSPTSLRRVDQKLVNQKVENAAADIQDKAMNVENAQHVAEQGQIDSYDKSKLDARELMFERNNQNELGGSKSAVHAVPLQAGNKIGSAGVVESIVEEFNGGRKEADISIIRMQLMQIENRQSNLFDMLQKFIDTSHNGIHSLETRVHGLEIVLDEISHDIAASRGAIYDNLSANKCCILPGAEFLSSRFRRRTEGRYSSRFYVSDPENLSEKETGGAHRWDRQRFGVQGGFVVNPLAEINPQSRGSLNSNLNIATNKVVLERGFSHAQDCV